MLEYINGGSLYQNLQKIGRFKEEETKFFIAQIAVSLSYLHKNNVVHRDLKPENVMLRENGYWVLADFGLSKFLNSENDLLRSRVGTDEYMAPELIKGDGYNHTLDWWTLGVLTYELVWGRTPFKSRNRK